MNLRHLFSTMLTSEDIISIKSDIIDYINVTMVPNTTMQDGRQAMMMMSPPVILPWFKMAVFVAYILFMFIGGLGNSLVCFVLATRKQRKRSIHLLTLNLAISDLIVTVIYLPTQIYLLQMNFKWVLGDAACRVLYGVNSCTVNASIGTLVAITYDRYIAVTKPMVAHKRNTRKTKIIIAIVWVVSIAITLPLLFMVKLNNGYCSEVWPSLQIENGYWIAIFVVQLPLPMLFISVAYAVIIYSVKRSQSQLELGKYKKDLKRKGCVKRESDILNNNGTPETKPRTGSRTKLLTRQTGKRRRLSHSRGRGQETREKRKKQKNKLLKMSIVLVITYGVCVTPQHAVFFAQKYGTLATKPYVAFVFILSNLLMSMNSAINPCIYGTLNDELKSSIIRCLTFRNTRSRISRNFGTLVETLTFTIRKRFKFEGENEERYV